LTIGTIILYSLCAGITIPIGSILSAQSQKIKNSTSRALTVHLVTAFGGGVLVAAVAFVLAPRALEELSPLLLAISFLTGGGALFILDRSVEKSGGRVAQLVSMLMDYLPEALSLGAVFAIHHNVALLLAIFIGLQNLPEAFNAYDDLIESGLSTRKAYLILFPLSVVGVVAALVGHWTLSQHAEVVAFIMGFASGGILYLMFQDVAPLTHMPNKWIPALGATIGFVFGMMGEKLIG
jgi:ZIP family zinc transporter